MKKIIQKYLHIFLIVCLLISASFILSGCSVSITDDEESEVASVDDKTNDSDINDNDINNADTDNSQDNSNYISYKFRNKNLLEQHYEKHGKEMGFDSMESYEQAASDVINNPNALHKYEKEDNDEVFYVEDTNEFVILSTDGYIRTYFLASKGLDYYNRQ